MSITEYKLRLNSVSKYTSYSKPQFEHIAGAITMYLSQFAYQYSAFDSMLFKQRAEEESVIKGLIFLWEKPNAEPAIFLHSSMG